MKSRDDPMLRMNFYLWFVILAIAAIDGIWLAAKNISLMPHVLVLIFLPVLGLLALAWFYKNIRKVSSIAALADMAAATLAFMAASCILSYLMVTLRQPPIDPWLVDADRAMSLDWLSFYSWVKAKPVLHIGMQYVYMTLIPQIFIMQIILNFRGQIARAWQTLWLFICVCLGCILCSGFWPAAGAFAYFHVQPNEPYVQEFAALRDGTLTAIGRRGALQGVVQFPSLHMALAVIFPYAMRGIPVAFPFFMILNILIMITTAPAGGHHFADLWGGALLALASIWLVRRYLPEQSFVPVMAKCKAVRGGVKKMREGQNPSRVRDFEQTNVPSQPPKKRRPKKGLKPARNRR